MKNNAKRNVFQYISIFMFFALIFVLFNVFSAKEHKFTYDEFIKGGKFGCGECLDCNCFVCLIGNE